MGYQSGTRKRSRYQAQETNFSWDKEIDGESNLGKDQKKSLNLGRSAIHIRQITRPQVVQNPLEIAGMKPINIEKLMNHSTGISDSYYRATEQEFLEDYFKAVDMLSINDDKLTLQKQVAYK